MSFHNVLRTSIGSLQLEIITMLWNMEMYGKEISDQLALRGKKISPGQLYPALNKMEQARLLDMRIQKHIGADKKYYRSSEQGQKLAKNYLQHVFMLFTDALIEEYKPYVEKIHTLAEYKEGMIVVDFSSRMFEEFLQTVCERIGVTGRCFVLNLFPNNEQILKDRLKYYHLADIVSILPIQYQKHPHIELPDNSVDLVFVEFTLNEKDTGWIVPEMSRVLKPGGKAVIVEAKELDNIIVRSILTLVPIARNLGINPDRLKQEFEKNGMKVLSEIEEQESLFYLVLEKN